MFKWITILLLTTFTAHAQIANDLPKGLMLNLNFQQVSEGLIPSKTLYPLFVPQGDLGLEKFDRRNMLAFQFGQGLDIPHSSLLDPNGDEWIVSVRVFPLTDGVIISQSNEQFGYIIYMKDGHVEVLVHTGHSTFKLREHDDRGRTKYKERWVTIELRIKKDMARLNLNQRRVDLVQFEPALTGENLRIQLGNHKALPAPFKTSKLPAIGFTGAINSFKILRQ